MNVRILSSVVPVVIFLALTRTMEPWIAILGGFMATAIVTYANRQDRLIGLLTVYGFVIVGICAVIGIAVNNEKAYLASGPIADFLFVPLYLGSVIVGRPIIGGITRELFPVLTHHIPHDASLWAWLTVGWTAYNISQGIFRFWLLDRLSVGEYIIWSRLLNWPLSMAMIGITAYFVLREARRHGHSLASIWNTWRGEPAS